MRRYFATVHFAAMARLRFDFRKSFSSLLTAGLQRVCDVTPDMIVMQGPSLGYPEALLAGASLRRRSSVSLSFVFFCETVKVPSHSRPNKPRQLANNLEKVLEVQCTCEDVPLRPCVSPAARSGELINSRKIKPCMWCATNRSFFSLSPFRPHSLAVSIKWANSALLALDVRTLKHVRSLRIQIAAPSQARLVRLPSLEEPFALEHLDLEFQDHRQGLFDEVQAYNLCGMGRIRSLRLKNWHGGFFFFQYY